MAKWLIARVGREMLEQLFDYLYQSNPPPRYLSLRSRRALPAGRRTSLHGVYTSNARAMLIVCQDLLGIIIPRMYHPDAQVHIPPRGERTRTRVCWRYARAKTTLAAGRRRSSLLSYLNVSPSPGWKFMFYLPRFYALASKGRDRALERSTSVIYHTMPTIRRLKRAFLTLCAFHFKTRGRRFNFCKILSPQHSRYVSPCYFHIVPACN